MVKDKLKTNIKEQDHNNKKTESNDKKINDRVEDDIQNKEACDTEPEVKDCKDCDDEKTMNNGNQLEEEVKEEIENIKDKLIVNEEEVKNKNEEIESLMDLLKRRQADFENYKKRMIKDKEEYRRLAVKDMALEIIDINDDLLRAIDAASNVSDQESPESSHTAFIDGVYMVSKRIEDTLKKYGIVEIDCINQEFDPKFNEAVEIDMSEDVAGDTITKVYQKGFRLDDYVLRCSRVRVTKPIKEV